ncbi:MAG: 2Fe-2S iron-sulfur cluster-binding protein [Candidatus Hydrogenedentales bacterium]|jgi:ferredoxin
MPTITINDHIIEVPKETTILEAAAQLGITIPTLCHADTKPPIGSCRICMVEDSTSGRLIPACSALAEEGMHILTESERVRQGRRAVLELMLSEHLGDCEAPCERACPAGLNIPLMLRTMDRGDMATAQQMARRALVLPATLGRVCVAPCEARCRRAVLDDAVAIRELHGQLGDMSTDTESLSSFKDAPSGKKVAIIGSGAAGLAAAFILTQYGHTCHVYDKAARAGGALRAYTKEELDPQSLENDLSYLEEMGVVFFLNTEVGIAVTLQSLMSGYDTVVNASAYDPSPENLLFHVKKHRLPVRSVTLGKACAEKVHAHLTEQPLQTTEVYQSILGSVSAKHIDTFVKDRVEEVTLSYPRNPQDPLQEVKRCLHCDCHKPVSCKLRDYATVYRARSKVFRNAERPPLHSVKRFNDILFDSGKCIKCGLCVERTKDNLEPLGLSFSGRGFNMEVTVPFQESLEKALTRSGAEVVALCPTGALAFDPLEERGSTLRAEEVTGTQ